MVTIDSITTRVQAEGVYDGVKLSGTVNIADSVESLEGSIYKKTNDAEIFVGTFSVNESVSININEKQHLGLITQAAEAITGFADEVLAEINKEG